VRLVNGSVLAHLLLFPERRLDEKPYRDLTAAGLERARDELAAPTPFLAGGEDGGEAARVRRELDWARRTLELACDLGLARLERGGAASAADLPAATRGEVARRLGALVEALPGGGAGDVGGPAGEGGRADRGVTPRRPRMRLYWSVT